MRTRNVSITLFVIVWLFVFNYESLRHFYINPLCRPIFKRDLPAMKMLFPPAGWIMFFNVGESFGLTEVYGLKLNRGSLTPNAPESFEPFLLDPHQIFRTRAIGYDNIHRNVLSTVLDEPVRRKFCQYLKWRFPEFNDFWVSYVFYPSVVKTPFLKQQKIIYQCG